MKNNLKTMLALMAGTLALSACSEEIVLENETPVMGGSTAPVLSFNAAIESDGTRAAIDGLDIKWQEGDAILLLDGTHSSKYNLTAGAGSTAASFVVDAESTPVEGKNIYAFYPYAASTLYIPTLDDAMDALGQYAWAAQYFDYWKDDIAKGYEEEVIQVLNSLVDSKEKVAIILAHLKEEPLGDPAPELDGNSITNVILPAEQIVAPGQNVDPKAVLMMAKADADHNLEFKNIASYIKVTTTRACKKIEVSGNNHEVLAGKFTITYDGVPYATGDTGFSPVVTLKAAEGYLAPGTYYIAVLPGTLDKGLNIKFFRGEDTFHYNNRTTSLTLARNKVNNGGDDNGATGAYWTRNIESYQWTNNRQTRVSSVTINTDETDKPSDAIPLNSDNTLWAKNVDGNYYIETSESRIFAQDLRDAFSRLQMVEKYEGLENIDVSDVLDYSYCFLGNENVKNLDLSSWQILPYANTSAMFPSCLRLETLTLNDTFHAGNEMFRNVGYYLNDNTCVVYGVTDDMVKNDLKGKSGINTCWDHLVGNAKTTKIIFDDEVAPLTKCIYTLGESFTNVATKIVIELGKNKSDIPAGATMGDLAHGIWAYLDAENVLHVQSLSNEPIEVDTSTGGSSNGLFGGCIEVTAIEGLNNLKVIGKYVAEGMFYNCKKLKSVDLTGLDLSTATRLYYTFYNCLELTDVKFSGNNTQNVTLMNFMFGNCSSLTTLDLSSLDTSSATYMSCMFSGCKKLQTIKGLTSFDTSNVTDMTRMFEDCRSLKSLDLSSFNTQNVTGMSSMFYYCTYLESLTLGDQFNLAKYTTTMFYNAGEDLPGSTKCMVTGPAEIESVITNYDKTRWNSSKMIYNGK